MSKRKQRIAEAIARPKALTRKIRAQERAHIGSRVRRFHPAGTNGDGRVTTHSGDVYSVSPSGAWVWSHKAA